MWRSCSFTRIPLLALAAAPIAAAGAVATSAPLSAQEAPAQAEGAAIVRESFYQVGFAELEAWNGAFATYLRPALEALREEGAIQGWSTWSHDTGGGPYNWRMAIRFHEGANVNAVVDDLVARIGEALGPASAEVQRMIRRHEDQIWTVFDASFREAGAAEGEAEEEAQGGETPRFYVASFQVNPADLEGWNAFYEATWKPALQEATAAGTLNGWVVLEHAHGGPHNWKIMLFAPDWDSLDDAWNAFFEAFARDEAAWMDALRTIESHDDSIWVPAAAGS